MPTATDIICKFINIFQLITESKCTLIICTDAGIKIVR